MENTRTEQHPIPQPESEGLPKHKRRKRRRDQPQRFWEPPQGPVPDPHPTSEQIADELED